jgi:hypothetical protein
MTDYAKALKVLEERAGSLRGQMSTITDELEAIRIAKKALTEVIENTPKPKPRGVATIVLPPADASRKPN